MKYEYADSNIEWIGKYPKHWKVFRISQRVESVVGGEWGSDPDSDDTEGSREIVVLRVSDFNDIYLSYDNLTIRRVKKTKIPNRLISGNCLIMEKSGGGEKQLVGRVAEARDLPFEAITSNFIAKLEFDTKVDNHYMNYVFHDLYNSNLNFPFVQQTTGIQNINSTYYLYTKVPFPPKPEQIAIANYLDKACADIDRVVEIKRKQIENLQQQLKSIIHYTVTKGLNPKSEMKDSGIDWIGEVPKHWRRRRIKDIVHLQSGDNIVSEQINDFDEFPVYGGNGLRGYFSDYTHEGEFVLIGRQGALCGNINYASGKFWASEHAVVATPIKKVSTIWLGEILRTMNLNQYSNSAAQPGLSVEKIKNLYFIVPPFEEQKQIGKFIEDYSSTKASVQSKIEKQIEVLLNYKKSLIHEVVTGKKQVYGLTKEKQQMQTA
jgi:type I restriction enzyme S subunit